MRRQKEKRVGRGGKRGKTAGRGEKGQGARSGHRIRPAERDLIQRLPKLRGIKHPRLSLRATAISLGDLVRVKGNEVTRAALVESGFIMHAKDKVKILGGGSISRALTVKGIPVSESAKKAIEAAGGKVE